MIKKIKLIYITIFFIFLSNCGFTPIYKSQNLNFYVNKINVDGEKNVNQLLISQIKKKIIDPSADQIPVDLFLNSSKNLVSAVKDKTGKTLEYKLEVTTLAEVVNAKDQSIIFKQQFSQSVRFNSKDQISETKITEERLLKNIVFQISNGLILKINQLVQNNDL